MILRLKRQFHYRIIPVILAVVITFFSFSPSVLADSSSVVSSVTSSYSISDLWDWFAGCFRENVINAEQMLGLNLDSCAYSDNLKHDFELQNIDGIHSQMVCQYCGLTAEEAYGDEYDNMVDDLSTTYGQDYITNSSTTFTPLLYRSSSISSSYATYTYSSETYSNPLSYSYCLSTALSSYYTNSVIRSLNFNVQESGLYTFSFSYYCLPYYSSSTSKAVSYSASSPVVYCSASVVSSASSSQSYSTITVNGLSVRYYTYTLTYYLDASSTYYFYHSYSIPSSSHFVGYNMPCYYSLTITPPSSVTSTYIDSSTRLASVNNYSSYYNTYINNNYTSGDTIYNYYIGTLNSNDEVNNVYDPDIYDEETLIFTEPVTGDQIQTSGWKYLYTSAARGYYLTLSDGTYYYQASDDDDVQEITNILLAYTDDCVYIAGFTQDVGEYSSSSEALADAAFIDQYYYVIAETETTDSDSDEDSCEHVFTTSTIVEPTCTDSGVRRYTCDLCGFTQDVTISALGHSYEVTETVETEYDGDDVTKVGYTLYTCSICGSTNKVYDTAVYPDYSGSGSSGGSDSSDDDDDDSSSSVWTTIKNAIAEALGTLITSLVSLVAAFMSGISSALEYLLENIVGTIVDFIVQIIEWLFNLIDFDYLTSWFSWFDDNEVLDDEFGTSGDSYDVWNYS